LLLGADRDQHVPRADRGLQWRIGQECSVMAAEGEHECPGCLAHIRLLQGAPGEPGARAHRYFLQAELQAAVMHHHVEELHHRPGPAVGEHEGECPGMRRWRETS